MITIIIPIIPSNAPHIIHWKNVIVHDLLFTVAILNSRDRTLKWLQPKRWNLLIMYYTGVWGAVCLFIYVRNSQINLYNSWLLECFIILALYSFILPYASLLNCCISSFIQNIPSWNLDIQYLILCMLLYMFEVAETYSLARNITPSSDSIDGLFEVKLTTRTFHER